jgi:indolepyruvate ferredoxin oxidoreductase beta subunit
MTQARAIKISINALGGQGGGVLSDWIVAAGELSGFIAQATSVPGVAQRTGATVYYIELFPRSVAEAAGKAPVLALMPSPGDVDIVIASELAEAGRAIQRGLVTAQTTLIASSHRVFAVVEKTAMADGRRNEDAILSAAKKCAGKFILGDMEAAADESGAPISAVLFGALAGARVLPILPSVFEGAIKQGGRAVEQNLKAFAKGLALADAQAPAPAKTAKAREAAAQADTQVSPFPPKAHAVIREGHRRVFDFQDAIYAQFYLDRLARLRDVDAPSGGEGRDWALLRAVAKHLALWMTYEDAIRVADLKTRASRLERVRKDVRAGPDQIVHVSEYLHPRAEEICDILPAIVAKPIRNSKMARRALKFALGEGRRVTTTKMRGFLPLYAMSRLRFVRRASDRYATEQKRIDGWLALIERSAGDYALACEIAGLQRLLKGYGDTHARGLRNYERIVAALPDVRRSADAAAALRGLRDAALADEDGIALNAALLRLNKTAPALSAAE